MTLSPEQRRALLRWRLVLGRKADGGCDGQMALADLAAGAEQDVFGLDGALELVYGDDKGPGGTSGSAPNIPRWLGDVRRYFPADVVAMVQKDAIERRGLRQLLFEKETLPTWRRTSTWWRPSSRCKG